MSRTTDMLREIREDHAAWEAQAAHYRTLLHPLAQPSWDVLAEDTRQLHRETEAHYEAAERLGIEFRYFDDR